MDKRLMELLLRSLEGPLIKRRDRLRLDRTLSESEELRRARDEFEALREGLAAGAASSFRPGFSGRVMAGMETAASENGRQFLNYDRFQKVFWRFTVASLVVLAILVSYNLTQGETIPQGDLLYAADQTVGEILKLPVF